jgi:hypothetical protein
MSYATYQSAYMWIAQGSHQSAHQQLQKKRSLQLQAKCVRELSTARLSRPAGRQPSSTSIQKPSQNICADSAECLPAIQRP